MFYRWTLQADMNGDGITTISDVWLWVKWFFFLPGDGVIAAILANPGLAQFLEITEAAYGGWPSGLVSLVAWLAVLVVAAIIQVTLEE